MKDKILFLQPSDGMFACYEAHFDKVAEIEGKPYTGVFHTSLGRALLLDVLRAEGEDLALIMADGWYNNRLGLPEIIRSTCLTEARICAFPLLEGVSPPG